MKIVPMLKLHIRVVWSGHSVCATSTRRLWTKDSQAGLCYTYTCHFVSFTVLWSNYAIHVHSSSQKCDFNIKFHHFLFSGRGDKKRRRPAYRPCYGQLGEMRSLVDGTVPVIALTATATKATREIIMSDLCLKNCIQIILNPGKANVKYSMENCRKDVTENFKWLLDLMKQYGSTCPRIIVFFRQIKQIAEVYEYLETNLGVTQFVQTDDIPKNGYWNRIFGMFHLTTNEKIKREICKSFQDENGCVRVVLSSTSFSMGLDVRDVNTVVHYGPANDIDDYLQESGRAGTHQ